MLNPSDEVISQIENDEYSKKQNLPSEYGFGYDECFKMLMGEDTRVIPSQWNVNLNIELNKTIILFDIEWMVLESYKVLDTDNKLIVRIY